MAFFVRLWFEGGRLLVEGAGELLGLSLRDPRTRCHVARPSDYASILAAAARRGVAVDDELAALLAVPPPRPSLPPPGPPAPRSPRGPRFVWRFRSCGDPGWEAAGGPRLRAGVLRGGGHGAALRGGGRGRPVAGGAAGFLPGRPGGGAPRGAGGAPAGALRRGSPALRSPLCAGAGRRAGADGSGGAEGGAGGAGGAAAGRADHPGLLAVGAPRGPGGRAPAGPRGREGDHAGAPVLAAR